MCVYLGTYKGALFFCFFLPLNTETMSSTNHLVSFFHQKSSKLARNATVKSTSTDTHILNAVKDDFKAIKRSATTISRVKRFGSILARSKQLPTINTSLVQMPTSCCSLASISTVATTSDESEEEEQILTPNASTIEFISKDVLVSHPVNQDAMMMLAVLSDQSKQHTTSLSLPSIEQVSVSNQKFHSCASLEPDKKQEPPLPLSDVFIVQDQLRQAFEQADMEIEKEIEHSRHQMLELIKATSRTMC